MASTACFLHHHAPSTTTTRTPSQRVGPSIRPTQIICKAQKQPEDEPNNAVSRRQALGVLIGGAALSTRVSPADAAYGEAGNLYHVFFILRHQSFKVESNMFLQIERFLHGPRLGLFYPEIILF